MATTGAQPGNQNATKRTRIISDAIRRKLVQDPARAARIAESILVGAENGDLGCFKELLDRVEGKAPQPIVGDDDSDPISIKELVIRAIDATHDRPPKES